jgi:hypothetical protein
MTISFLRCHLITLIEHNVPPKLLWDSEVALVYPLPIEGHVVVPSFG